jgi:hypothetical protein
MIFSENHPDLALGRQAKGYYEKGGNGAQMDFDSFCSTERLLIILNREDCATALQVVEEDWCKWRPFQPLGWEEWS